jgi:molybdopterin-guanine dinucleotide biosynthesis protein B
MIPVVSIIGRSNSGKTTLIEKIVTELKKRKYRVGTIKHDAHSFEIDYEGKDSYRHFQAGSNTVLLASSRKVAMIKRLEEEISLNELVGQYFRNSDTDIIITEGYKTEDKLKIEVYRSAMHPEPISLDKNNRLAFVTDKKLPTDLPQFGLDDAVSVASFIEEKLLRKLSQKSGQELLN